MTAGAPLRGDERVLEVGTGSGYQAAVLARLAREVYTIERVPVLARRARWTLRALGSTTCTSSSATGRSACRCTRPTTPSS